MLPSLGSLASRACVCLPSVLCALVAAPAAQAVKLNAPLGIYDHTDAYGPLLASDGSTLVYLADHVDPGFVDLYAVQTDGSGAALRLTRAEASEQHIISFALTPDGRAAVYSANTSTTPTVLWHVPLDASRAPLELLVASEVSGTFLVSANSARVFHQGIDRLLWSVATDGVTPPTRLTDTPNLVLSKTLSADGTKLVVGGVSPTTSLTSILSVPTDGSRAVVTLVQAGSALSSGFFPRLSSDQNWVVYGLSGSGFPGDVYRVPLDGSAPPIRLGTHQVRAFDTSPDGTELALYMNIGGGQYDLALARIADGRLRPLNDPRAGFGPVLHYTPDGSALIYTLDSGGFAPHPLLIRHLERRAPSVLGQPLDRVLAPDVDSFVVSPLGTHIVYTSRLPLVTPDFELFSLALRPGAERVSLGTLPDSLQGLTFLPDGSRVLVQVAQTTDEELFSVPIDGSSPPISLAPGIEVSHFVSPPFLDGSGERVVIKGDLDLFTTEFFMVPADGSQPPRRLNVPPPPYRYPITKFDFSADGTHVLYHARVSNERQGLFSAPVDGSRPAVELAHMQRNDPIQSQATSPDGATTYFVARRVFLNLLFRVPTDGSAWPERLVDFNARRVLPTFKLTPDGAHIVYLSTEADPEIEDLYSVPTDGSRARVQLSVTSVDIGQDFQLTPDGTRVVYRGPNLHSVPTQGGVAPTFLSTYAGRFELSSDGTYVVFEATDGIRSVRVDGSGPVVVLGTRGIFRIGQASERVVLASASGVSSVPIAGGTPVTLSALPGYELLLGAGGAFFRTGPSSDDSDLYAAAVDGSLGSSLLNPPRIPGTTLSLGFLAEPARRVVYQVHGPSATTAPTLMSVRFDGSSPVALNLPRDPGERPLSFQPTPDGRAVLYLGDDEFQRVRQLYSIPVSGGARTRINDPMPDQGDVQSFLVGPAGRALYLADQDSPQVFELYSVEYE